MVGMPYMSLKLPTLLFNGIEKDNVPRVTQYFHSRKSTKRVCEPSKSVLMDRDSNWGWVYMS